MSLLTELFLFSATIAIKIKLLAELYVKDHTLGANRKIRRRPPMSIAPPNEQLRRSGIFTGNLYRLRDRSN
jgi:hypothetical protein